MFVGNTNRVLPLAFLRTAQLSLSHLNLPPIYTTIIKKFLLKHWKRGSQLVSERYGQVEGMGCKKRGWDG